MDLHTKNGNPGFVVGLEVGSAGSGSVVLFSSLLVSRTVNGKFLLKTFDVIQEKK